MLCVEKATLVPFGEEELKALIKSKSWKSMLPSALGDEQLLQLSDRERPVNPLDRTPSAHLDCSCAPM